MISTDVVRLYHGSPDSNLIPSYKSGKEYHDYGKGLYCVEDLVLAKEWACQHNVMQEILPHGQR